MNTIEGICACFDMNDVDTDQIIPKQHLKTIERAGLGKALFSDQGPEFILKKPPFTEARILIAGRNFGCGSSREHAVWALLDFGIKAVVAPSFAEIFSNNADQNGLWTIAINESDLNVLKNSPTLKINLEAQSIATGDATVAFHMDAGRKARLLSGKDKIGATLEHHDKIQTFEKKFAIIFPWLFEVSHDGN